MIPLPKIAIVREKTASIVERLGRFQRILLPGFYILSPLEREAGRVSLQIQEMNVHVETKTIDDVFVRITVAVQYYVMPDRIREAFYELSNPRMQIESYVYDEVRAHVPRMKLDDVFQNKDDIANAVKTGLEETMNQYGYDIVKSLVNDIDPDAKVKQAMNEINAAQRFRRASEERGEAEKILRVKQAEAEAQSSILRGKGIAGQRKAIIDGLRQSVEEFQKSIPGSSPNEVMQVVIMTQYFDTLKEIGGSSRTNTLLIPHTPGSIGTFSEQISRSVMTGNLTASVFNASAEGTENEPRVDPDDLSSASEPPVESTPPEQPQQDQPSRRGHMTEEQRRALHEMRREEQKPGDDYPRTTPPRGG